MNIYPALRYRDGRAAVDWLCEAFGFEIHAAHPPEGQVEHAELRLGSSMIMVGTGGDSLASSESGSGSEVDFAAMPFSLYVAVDDPDAHCERAKAAGAEILREPADMEYESREYSARDLGGFVWSFGTYHPAVG